MFFPDKIIKRKNHVNESFYSKDSPEIPTLIFSSVLEFITGATHRS